MNIKFKQDDPSIQLGIKLIYRQYMYNPAKVYDLPLEPIMIYLKESLQEKILYCILYKDGTEIAQYYTEETYPSYKFYQEYFGFPEVKIINGIKFCVLVIE